MFIVKNAAPLIFLLALHSAPVLAAADLSAWAHSGYLYLDTSPSGADVTGTVTRFPILVRLDASNFDFSEARGDGRDLRFTTVSGDSLPRRIERWDSAAAVAEVWTRADTVLGSRADQFLRMYWGRPEEDSVGAKLVFDSAAGFMAAWHLGGANSRRANAVAGGEAAAGQSFDGDESKRGIIAFCDSLDGAPDGQDHIGIYDGYAQASQGFTFSAWVNPAAALPGARILDMGNGDGQDNVILARHLATDTLSIDVFNGAAKSGTILVPGALPVGEWGHLAITIQGLAVRAYRNGFLVHSDTLSQRVSPVRRGQSFLGKNSGSAGGYFQGKLDQVELASVPRSSDWIKLSHANQASGGKLVSLRREAPCRPMLQPSRDTALAEGSLIDLFVLAECALEYSWSALSGPAPRILDPSTDTLQVRLPRVAADTAIVFRIEVRFQDSLRTSEIRVRVLEAVPDPVFTLPESLSWTGRDTLTLKPVISNLAAIRASPESTLAWGWTLEGLSVDSAWQADGLRLFNPQGTGEFRARLCLHNNGAPACREAKVKVYAAAAAALAHLPARNRDAARRDAFRDVVGRLRTYEAGAQAGRFPRQPPSGKVP